MSPSATERRVGNNKNNCEDNLLEDGSQPRAAFRRAGWRGIISKLFFKLFTLFQLPSLAHSIPKIAYPHPDGLRSHGRIGRAGLRPGLRHPPRHPQQNGNSAQTAAAAWLGFANPNPCRTRSPTTKSTTRKPSSFYCSPSKKLSLSHSNMLATISALSYCSFVPNENFLPFDLQQAHYQNNHYSACSIDHLNSLLLMIEHQWKQKIPQMHTSL